MMNGFWNYRTIKEKTEMKPTFSIVTIEAHESMRQVHGSRSYTSFIFIDKLANEWTEHDLTEESKG